VALVILTRQLKNSSRSPDLPSPRVDIQRLNHPVSSVWHQQLLTHHNAGNVVEQVCWSKPMRYAVTAKETRLLGQRSKKRNVKLWKWYRSLLVGDIRVIPLQLIATIRAFTVQLWHVQQFAGVRQYAGRLWHISHSLPDPTSTQRQQNVDDMICGRPSTTQLPTAH